MKEVGRGVLEGSTRQGGAPYRGRALQGGRSLLSRGLLEDLLTSSPSLRDDNLPKNHDAEGFIPFGLRLIFLFFEILKQAKKTAIWTGTPVNRLVPKVI